jgi:hypothetical protein
MTRIQPVEENSASEHRRSVRIGEMAGVEVKHFAASFRISELAPSVRGEPKFAQISFVEGQFFGDENRVGGT